MNKKRGYNPITLWGFEESQVISSWTHKLSTSQFKFWGDRELYQSVNIVLSLESNSPIKKYF